jgi:hypothetical protein
VVTGYLPDVRYWWRIPQTVFFGAFEEHNNPLKLTLVCAANHMQDKIEADYIVGKGYSNC